MRAFIVLVCVFVAFASPSAAGSLSGAAKNGDLAQVEQLLANGEDVNETDGIASPIHWAAMNGHAFGAGAQLALAHDVRVWR